MPSIYQLSLPCTYPRYCFNCKLTTTQASSHITTARPNTASSLDSDSGSPVSKQPPRPNTRIHYPLFTTHTIPMPAGQLKMNGWKELTSEYPDQQVIKAILGICQYGARIGYEGQRSGVVIHPNLASAEDNTDLVAKEIESEMKKERLELYSDSFGLPNHYTASPLGLADKADGSKRRIHHLSYPAGLSTAINSGIPELYGTIVYSGIDEGIRAVQELGKNCILMKRDFESAFRHIPVSPQDTPLLGFHWRNRYYAERFLPFGLRTAPYLFNLFAEVFHWIIDDQLKQQNSRLIVIHYLDDFLLALPPGENPAIFSENLSQLCNTVGLTIKSAKNEEGKVVSFAGIEFDTEGMVVHLPQKKLFKAQAIVQRATGQKSLSLLEIQKITGYLNFVSTVIPLGRTFVRHLYNMELFFPPGSRHQQRRISREAQRDLSWWAEALSRAPARSIAKRKREVIRAWSDAASTKGLGAFYLSENQSYPERDTAFSIPLPASLAKGREHINTQEMRAVEQVLLHWGADWIGKRLIIHIDNRAVVHGLTNRTIRGASMQVLRRCLLLATEFDLDLEARWVSTKENALADALSRVETNRIANIAPQLLSPTSSPPKLGFRTYRNRGCQK